MRKIKIHLLLLLPLLFIFTSPVQARNIGALPFEEHFESTDWAQAELGIRPTGSKVLWESSAGWQGSGAAKLAPPTAAEGYATLGIMDGFGEQTRLNVRFLLYHGATLTLKAPHDKLIILNRVNDATRPMVISGGNWVNGENERIYFACHGTVCGNRDDRFSMPMYVNREYANQWISFEYEVDLVNQVERVYIYTQDGRAAGLYSEHRFSESNAANSPIFRIEGIGHYWGPPTEISDGVFDDETYIMIDELKVDNQYIGPPLGFLSDPPPAAPARTR
jgi:hypothetical protein